MYLVSAGVGYLFTNNLSVDFAAQVYRLKKSPANISGLLQVLQVVVRGLGRAGDADDLALLQRISDKENGFYRLADDARHGDQVRRLMKWIHKSMEETRTLSADDSDRGFSF